MSPRPSSVAASAVAPASGGRLLPRDKGRIFPATTTVREALGGSQVWGTHAVRTRAAEMCRAGHAVDTDVATRCSCISSVPFPVY